MREPQGAREAPAEGRSCRGLQESGCRSAVTSSIFLLQSSSKGGEQDGKNSRKRGFCLNNMSPELLHGNKGISYVATYLIWILIVCAICMFRLRAPFRSTRHSAALAGQNFGCVLTFTVCFLSALVWHFPSEVFGQSTLSASR